MRGDPPGEFLASGLLASGREPGYLAGSIDTPQLRRHGGDRSQYQREHENQGAQREGRLYSHRTLIISPAAGRHQNFTDSAC
jgi:hypothetical protein